MSTPLTWSNQWRWNQPGLTWNGDAPTERINMAIHVSLGFAQLKDPDLVTFAAGVVTGLTGNANFTTPPVSATTIGTQKTAFETALAAAENGGKTLTTAKNTARDTLVNSLRQDAVYVEQQAGGVEAKITSSGFQVASRVHSPMATMPKATILQIINETSGQLLVRIQAIANAHSYEAQTQVGAGAWTPAGISSQARRFVIPNLTPGTTYNVRVRAVGAGQSYGDWSDPVSHICT
jgi:hypothetical protein